MYSKIPEFKMVDDNPESVYTDPRFHERILELVKESINGNDNHILCNIVYEDNLIVAELPKESHYLALSKSLDFFVGLEDYDMCMEIKDVLSKIK